MSFGPIPDSLLSAHSFGQTQPSSSTPMTRISPRNWPTKKIQIRKQQETLLRDLLSVVDALDRAADHWQQAEAKHQNAQSAATPSLNWWQRGLQRIGLYSTTPDNGTESENLAEVVSSAREGIDLIRESMLTVLNQHQVAPIPRPGAALRPQPNECPGTTARHHRSPQHRGTGSGTGLSLAGPDVKRSSSYCRDCPTGRQYF